MRQVRIAISYELLCDLLHLPEGTRIVRTQDDICADRLNVILENPILPEVPQAALIPEAHPTFYRKPEPDPDVVFRGWGKIETDKAMNDKGDV